MPTDGKVLVLDKSGKNSGFLFYSERIPQLANQRLPPEGWKDAFPVAYRLLPQKPRSSYPAPPLLYPIMLFLTANMARQPSVVHPPSARKGRKSVYVAVEGEAEAEEAVSSSSMVPT